jgi:hypothetical protein
MKLRSVRKLRRKSQLLSQLSASKDNQIMLSPSHALVNPECGVCYGSLEIAEGLVWSCESPEPRDHRGQIASARKHPRAEREREARKSVLVAQIERRLSDYIRLYFLLVSLGRKRQRREAEGNKTLRELSRRNFES